MLEPPLGLRERKKLKTRAAIQKEGMRLFLQKGFQATTIEEIAEAVEISPSTFFNYFPSKEDVVMQDDLDPLMIELFNSQPPELSPITAMRYAMRTVFTSLSPEEDALARQRMKLIAADSDLRAAMLNRFLGTVREVADIVATRTGLSPNDFAVRNMAGALLGVLMSALVAVEDRPDADLIGLVDDAMAHLEAGLPLGQAPKD
ncbi:MAG TPA: TetR family transcriptional regulator [Candidatus Dormibacteraeota bacterium]